MFCIEKPSPPRLLFKAPGPPSRAVVLSLEYVSFFATLFPFVELNLTHHLTDYSPYCLEKNDSSISCCVHYRSPSYDFGKAKEDWA